jgi:hypothetical protein
MKFPRILLFAFLLIGCSRDHLQSSPSYAMAMLETTQVQWDLDGDRIGGGYEITHSGDPEHRYMVSMSVASNGQEKFMISDSKPGQLSSVRRLGWRDLDPVARERIDWSTARILITIRIYDKDGRVIFHASKQSAPFEGVTDSHPINVLLNF